MVKNTSGGTKTKGLARKHVKNASGGGGGQLRLPENELEELVYVNSMLGNGMCEVYNDDGQRFIAHIRNKFKGRHKRSNLISKNSIILCGYRDWENPYKNLDVIYIYDDFNIRALRDIPTIQIHNLFTRIEQNNIFKQNNSYPDDDIFQNNNNNLQHTTKTPHSDFTHTHTHTHTDTDTQLPPDFDLI